MVDYPAIYLSLKKGDLRLLYDNMYRGLMVYAVRLLGDELAFMAEDCVQEAVMSTYENRDRLESVEHWRNFIMTCVRNNAALVLRKRNYHSKYLEMSEHEDPHQELALDVMRQEILDTLYSAVENLPDTYRDIFRMSFEDGMKIKDIAEQLNVAEITVKKRKSRLLEILRLRTGLSDTELILLLSLIASN